MIGRLNHVAIAVRDIAKAAEVYRKTLGATVSAVIAQPAHGVNTVFTPCAGCGTTAETVAPSVLR